MLLQQFQHHLKQNFSFLSAEKDKLLLAVSGGIDSVVMTDLFNKCGFNFSIAHCNFQLRNEESERDESFVRDLAFKLTKEIFIQRFNTIEYAETGKVSIQEAARELRYKWFAEIIKNDHSASAFNYIATAHNADDNIETSLMFFLRGTGIHGLTGINTLDKQRKIIRPLLFATRKEIENYAQKNNIGWVEDSSNATEKYTRNFLRNKFIPLIEGLFPSVKNNLAENISRFKNTELLYDEAIQSYKKKLLEFKGDEIHIPILKLQKVKALDAVLWEIIQEFNFHSNQVEEVKKIFTANNSSYIQSSTHKIIKNRNWLIIAEKQANTSSFILIETPVAKVKFESGFLQFETFLKNNDQFLTNNSIAQLDADKIQFPLILRKWKQGDYFYPLGMQKKKKLSRFFIDQKLSSIQKENVWVLEMDKKIIWVIGYRIDDRFKISTHTETALKILNKETFS